MTGSPVDHLPHAADTVAALVDRIPPHQWAAPTPCTEWSVRDVVDHLVGMNLVMAALLTESRAAAVAVVDLLAHGWDLAQATGLVVETPDDLVEPALVFVRSEPPGQQRSGRFAEEQRAGEEASAIDRLAAFTGRRVPSTGTPGRPRW